MLARRVLLLACVLALGSMLPASPASAKAPAAKTKQLKVKSRDGKRVAEVRARAAGGQALFVDGKRVWPARGDAPAAEVTGPVSWSRGGDAVAWLARRQGHTLLVVALSPPGGGEGSAQALEWLVPAEAGPARAIMWLGPTRVAVGPREMEPKLVASWSRAE